MNIQSARLTLLSIMAKLHKVIGIGFHKTGTTTLGDCLRILGYKHISASRKAFIAYHHHNLEKVLKMMEKYDSFEDWPWPFIYKEAYERFPESKFILTRRINEDVWFNSLNKHVVSGAGEGFHYRKYIYGYDKPSDNSEFHKQKYIEHIKNVRDFFSDKRERFIEVSWEEGDSWEQLCSFLGHKVPNIPFPHSNQYEQNFKIPLNKRLLGLYYSVFNK